MNKIEAALLIAAIANAALACLLLSLAGGWAYIGSMMLLTQVGIGILCDV